VSPKDLACFTLVLKWFSRKLWRPQWTSSLPMTSPDLTWCDRLSIETGQRSRPFSISLNLGISSLSIPTTCIERHIACTTYKIRASKRSQRDDSGAREHLFGLLRHLKVYFVQHDIFWLVCRNAKSEFYDVIYFLYKNIVWGLQICSACHTSAHVGDCAFRLHQRWSFHALCVLPLANAPFQRLLHRSGTVCRSRSGHRRRCKFSAADWKPNFLPGSYSYSN